VGGATVFALAAGLAEEPGWRGVAHDGLAGRAGLVRATLSLGIVWSVWHLPLYLLEGTYQHGMGLGTADFWLSMAARVPLAVLLVWLVVGTRGAVVAAVAAHALGNAVGEVLPGGAGVLAVETAVLALPAAVVLWRWHSAARRPAQAPGHGDAPDRLTSPSLAEVAPLPRGYPGGYEREAVLLDGRRVRLRPVVPGDGQALAAAIASADPETLQRRFLGGGPPRGQVAVQRLVTVDYVHRFALAAFAPTGQGIGIARYEGERTWPVVDAAVVVDPAWRGVGLARELLRPVLERAMECGATQVVADFYADNARVHSLLAEAGLPETRSIAEDVVHDEIELPGRAGRAPGADPPEAGTDPGRERSSSRHPRA
jgi:GNAT superfamily N-acetyltransferase